MYKPTLHAAGDEPITAAQVALLQRGAEILSSRPPVFQEPNIASRSFGLIGGSNVKAMPPKNQRWAARHMLVVTTSSLVLCLLVGSLLLMDVGDQAPGLESFLAGGASREDALLSGTVQKKSAATARLAQLAH